MMTVFPSRRHYHIHECPGTRPDDFHGTGARTSIEAHKSHFWLCHNPECPVKENEYRCGIYQDALDRFRIGNTIKKKN